MLPPACRALQAAVAAKDAEVELLRRQNEALLAGRTGTAAPP